MEISEGRQFLKYSLEKMRVPLKKRPNLLYDQHGEGFG